MPFDSEEDFTRKINENKDFRIKIQKLVYLSKFFGWKNDYVFTLNERGPYSVNLANNYYDKQLFEKDSIEIFKFSCEEFFKFIENKSNDFLEATSTLLYIFKNKVDMFYKESCMALLDELKPNIPENIKLDAYNEIKKYDLFSKVNYDFSIKDVDLSKDVLINKVEKIMNNIDFLKVCRNQTLVLGSLEFMRVVMEIEDVELNYK